MSFLVSKSEKEKILKQYYNLLSISYLEKMNCVIILKLILSDLLFVVKNRNNYLQRKVGVMSIF